MIVFIYPRLYRGNIIVSGVLFIVSAGTAKERTAAFLCCVNLMVWRKTGGNWLQGSRQSARTVVGGRDGQTCNK